MLRFGKGYVAHESFFQNPKKTSYAKEKENHC
jgi:hypothetical protein